MPKVETMPTAPLSPYALQKLVAEQYCQMFTQAVRPGDGDDPLLQRVRAAAGSFVAVFRRDLAVHQRAVRGPPPKIYGDGEQTRDFTYVANVVDGVLRACHAKDASGEVINVATNGRVSLNQLFRRCEISSARRSSRSTTGREPGTCATRRPTSARPAACLDTPARHLRTGPEENGRVVSGHCGGGARRRAGPE